MDDGNTMPILKKILHSLALFFVLIQTFGPVGNAFAASGQYPNPNFYPPVQIPVSGELVYKPAVNAVPIMDVDLQNTWTSNYASIKIMEGDTPHWVQLNDREAGARGLDPATVASVMKRVNGKGSYVVYSKYFAELSQLKVEVYETWYGSDSIYHMRRIDYTPLYGRFFKAQRMLTTQAERATGVTHDPFLSFYSGDQTDPIFYNVSPQAAAVILGAAMAKFQAPVGFMSVDVPDLQQWTTTSGNFLRKTTTTHTRGYASTSWFIAGTKEMNPHGTTTAICAVTVNGGSGCDAPEHILNSGISLSPWKGGNAPTAKDLLYSADESNSSWTVAAFMIVAIAIGALSGGAGLALFETAGLTSTALGLTGGAAVAAEAVAGGAIYATAAFTAQGSTSIVDAQASYYGQIQNGAQTPAQVNNQYLSALLLAIEGKQILSNFGYGLTADQQVLLGSCPMYVSQSSCYASGLDPGTMPRPDTLQENDNMRSVYERFQYCKSNLNLTGGQLQQCAAPSLNLNDPTVVHYNTPDFN
ncbi:hypothetical protein ICN48_06510 [Polynucleobacter sp. JS-Safj-400b-B2]|uniref:hypothetical protein n=1 Tax=Polynucleobacter sp. JS-Safj-400b-B2 TaxID=2576921 RepID=UPI001C0CFE06|nr:hypothetical protein [Polynucleobacter sp. JS-Safj-400b-B2]MBU3625885.1 hypothetical protein [Polynucleobacter sp. JS-Safj-400b-B2]